MQAQIQCKGRVLLHTAGLGEAEVRAGWLELAEDLAGTLHRLWREAGPGPRLAVLPGGPDIIPYLAG